MRCYTKHLHHNIYTHVLIIRPRCYIRSKQSYHNNNLRLGPKMSQKLCHNTNCANHNYQHPISSRQIKLFQNIKQYKIKIKMCVII